MSEAVASDSVATSGHATIQIFVDGDACPVKAEVEKVAARHALAVTIVVMAVLLFGGAGTLNWPLGWWFIIAFVACVLIAMAII